MGKATILGSGDKNLERGQYKIRIEKSDSRVAQELKRIRSEITILDTTISDRYSDYNTAQTLYNRSVSDLDAIIQQSKESPDSDYSEKLQSATAAERDSYSTLASSKSRYQAARLKQRSLQGKELYLDNNITEDIRTVWCADCQRNLSGTVATIEIPNTDDTILIRPGGANGSGADYSTNRDGQLRSVSSMSPAEAAWNYTMFPGWQKFKPLYRLGKITERLPGNGKCSVLLDAYSTVQGLTTDVERNLENVPMIYKNRDDGGPYVVGDRVVVEFYNQNWEAPRVVGFEDYPCTTSSTISSSSSSSSSTTSSSPPSNIFVIKFTRGDGEAVTEDWFTGGDPPNTIVVTFKDSLKNTVAMTRTYNPVTGYFTFDFPLGHSIDPNGYWIYSNGYRSLITFYPETYKIDDRYDVSDLLHPGVYEFHMPYYYETSATTTGDSTTAQMTYSKKVYSSVPWRYEPSITADAGRTSVVRRSMDYGISQVHGWACCEAHSYVATEPRGPLIFSALGSVVGSASSLDYTLDLDIVAGPVSHNEIGGAGLPAVDERQEVEGPLAPISGTTLSWTLTNNCPATTYTNDTCTGCDLVGPIPAEFYQWVAPTLTIGIWITTPYYY